MSSVSSPIHRYSGDYENTFYDQNFTADISNKMRVPTKILVTGGDEADRDEVLAKETIMTMSFMDGKVNMRVPDRIVVAGHEQHMEAKAPPRELHLEQVLTPQPIRVETPPRVLTLEDHYFPTVDEDSENDDNEAEERTRHVSDNPENQQISQDDNRAMLPSTPPFLASDNVLSPSEEVLALRRHLLRLTRRVACLEQDTQARQQREMVITSLGVAYFVLKALLWLHRHW